MSLLSNIVRQHTLINPNPEDLIFSFPTAEHIALTSQLQLPTYQQWLAEHRLTAKKSKHYCFAVNQQQQQLCLAPTTTTPAHHHSLQACPMRQLNNQNPELAALANLSYPLHLWLRHTHCSMCTKTLQLHPHEHALYCISCNNIIYPRINPCIVVLIKRGQHILLAKSCNQTSDHFGLIAGFIESGETAEACVRREVAEEVSLEITNIRYIASQAWPFSSSLMLGFTADYAGGKIKVQPEELLCADFYTADQLPPVAGKHSLSGQLIERWLQQQL